MRILVIEDDTDIADFLKHRFEEKCFAVDIAHDGATGSKLATLHDYDAILLDYGLPGKNGFDICNDIRTQENIQRRTTPIIMISVTNDMSHRVHGLNNGADDYVIKPFYFEEVFARLQAILRRPQMRNETIIVIQDLTIDTTRQQVKRGKKIIHLTRKEFALLEQLALHNGEVVSKNKIIEHVWDGATDLFSTKIETHILNLRKKIDNGFKHKLIQNVSGRGYILNGTEFTGK